MPQTLAFVSRCNDFPPSALRRFVPQMKIVSRTSTHAEIIRFMLEQIELRFGIKPTTSLSRKLLAVFEHLSIGEFAEWAERMSSLSAADSEWFGLVECLTVHETYFNRDPGLLLAIRNRILPELIERAQAAGSFKVRIWSAACSTGEEAYNLAFLLLDALHEAGHASDINGSLVADPKWQIEIVGSDLSKQALDIAAAAVYSDHGLGSFRGLPEKMWRFFEESQEPNAGFVPGARYWRVRSYVKRLVRFQRCNLLLDQPPETDCDLTICRNVMIYFDEEPKLHVQGMLASSLKPGSFLVQGTTDVQLLSALYQAETDGAALYYRKK